MPLTRKAYTVVPGQSRRRGFLGGRTILLYAEEHLLLVTAEMATEHYRRFYFRDIEAIVACRTRERTWINLFLLLCSALTGWGMAMALRSETPPLAAVPAVILALFLLGMLINSLSGSRCRVTLQTRVQKVSLPSLQRIAQLRKALACIEPLIWAAQSASAEATVAPAAQTTAPTVPLAITPFTEATP